MRNTTMIRISEKDKKRILEIKNYFKKTDPNITSAKVIRLINIDVDLDKIAKRLKESKVYNLCE